MLSFNILKEIKNFPFLVCGSGCVELGWQRGPMKPSNLPPRQISEDPNLKPAMQPSLEDL